MQKLADELQKEGCKEKMSCYRCDVTKEDEVVSMFEKINAEHGGIDVLINNAGLTRDAPLLSGDVTSWNLMLQVSRIEQQISPVVVLVMLIGNWYCVSESNPYNGQAGAGVHPGPWTTWPDPPDHGPWINGPSDLTLPTPHTMNHLTSLTKIP